MTTNTAPQGEPGAVFFVALQAIIITALVAAFVMVLVVAFLN